MFVQSDGSIRAENPRAIIGSNNPPPFSPIDETRPVYKKVAQYLKDTPIIDSEEHAIEANEVLAIARKSLKELESEESKEADPLYSAWKAAKAKYKPAIDSMKRIIDELGQRLRAFMLAEEARREREAEEARQKAAEAERLAREAERLEHEARENAALGEVGVGVGEAIEKADEAFADFQKAQREAAIVEKDSSVRFKSRFQSKATTLRTVETLVLDDADRAIKALGVTEKIREAILSSAREYRKQHGALPDGVSAKHDKTI